MVDIFLFFPGQFYQHAIKLLGEKGIQVTYVVAGKKERSSIQIENEHVFHDTFDAIIGRPPVELSHLISEAARPDEELLLKMEPYKEVVYQLFERLSYRSWDRGILHRLYREMVGYWWSVLKSKKPAAVIFQAAPHMGFDYVVYGLCCVMGIKTLIVERTYLPGDYLILWENLYKREIEKFEPQYVLSSTINTEEDQGIHLDNSEQENCYSLREVRFRSGRWLPAGRLNLFKHQWKSTDLFLQECVRSLPNWLSPWEKASHYYLDYVFDGHFPSTIADIYRVYKGRLYMDELLNVYESLAKPVDTNCKYVFFVMHYQPERTSVPLAGKFADQLLALDILVKSLPEGWVVYVKEHFRQFYKPSRATPCRIQKVRSKAFYQKISEYGADKIRLVSLNEPTKELIQKAQCVATLTGTAGWEAVQACVPTMVFGYPWYMYCPGVNRVETVEEAREILQQIDAGKSGVSMKSISQYIEWYKQNFAFKGYQEDVFASKSVIAPEQNGSNHAEAIIKKLIA